ncbi:hypothetical protein EVAR_89681_1 [Eumeta japonica]|uniref:Uncharacterized protein n=1 Tax=Eumeta variegata TaxID=151549 RepID=A0A4C1X0L2_EUMVA|nr:hypothetical protein EVAR_89681_1 [Eumeta japonica]
MTHYFFVYPTMSRFTVGRTRSFGGELVIALGRDQSSLKLSDSYLVKGHSDPPGQWGPLFDGTSNFGEGEDHEINDKRTRTGSRDSEQIANR